MKVKTIKLQNPSKDLEAYSAQGKKSVGPTIKSGEHSITNCINGKWITAQMTSMPVCCWYFIDQNQQQNRSRSALDYVITVEYFGVEKKHSLH